MRPINLIPLEDRRGEHAPLRTGPLPYVLLAALVALLVGVTALVLVGNEITDSKNEVTKLEAEDAAASAKAQRLASYTQFRSMSEARVATVASLADSRFDWERVMRELSLILPRDTWLTSLTGDAGGETEGGGSGSSALSGALGPTLELSGCSTGQEAVAGFVTALKDIDGVTRVGVASSELPDKASSGTEGGAAATQVVTSAGRAASSPRSRSSSPSTRRQFRPHPRKARRCPRRWKRPKTPAVKARKARPRARKGAEMKLQMNSSNRAIVAVAALAVLAAAFWMMLLSPKRDEAKELGTQVEQLKSSLAQHEAEVAAAEEARADFPGQYQRLVVLGKAVPGDDDVASLLVQLNRIAGNAGGTFRNIQLTASGGGEEAPATPATGIEGEPASPTEVAASLLPLGASVGPAGLAVMPYEVTFDGDFFQIADFIEGIDSLVKTDDEDVRVDGRLVTIDSFSLEANSETGFPALEASFSLTTYLTPPGADAAADASPSATAPAMPAATTTGGGP